MLFSFCILNKTDVPSPIDATITLLNDWKRKSPTYLTLDTGNGYVQGLLHLTPTNSQYQPNQRNNPT
jgi:hypothetical protein